MGSNNYMGGAIRKEYCCMVCCVVYFMGGVQCVKKLRIYVRTKTILYMVFQHIT